MPKIEVAEIKDTYEWLDDVKSSDKIPQQSQWMTVLLMKDFHRRLKDIEEAAHEREHSTKD